MGKTAFRYLCALLAILFASCSKEGPLDKMEHIKMVGNDHPKQALAMLDSLEQEARRGSVYAQKKYDLLHIRLSDKANILPKSDAKIKELVEYFGKNGSDQEKQEVYYYAGSVYRDLQDCPRALEYFYKSTDFAIGHPDCDSIMLRNTYSNLNFLQYRVQNYKEALAMSKEELRISKELGTEDVVDHMHVGAAYKATGNAKEAVKEYDKAFHIADNYQGPIGVPGVLYTPADGLLGTGRDQEGTALPPPDQGGAESLLFRTEGPGPCPLLHGVWEKGLRHHL